MLNYEVTFIVDPVLSGDEIKAAAQTYVDRIKSDGAKIIHIDEMGLQQLAYPINRRSSGVYYCVEFETETGHLIDPMELAFRRDERIMRFLTVKLDKYGVKYNADKRAGLIGKVTKKKKKEDSRDDRGNRGRKSADRPAAKPAPKAETATSTKAPTEPKKEVTAPVKEKIVAPAPNPPQGAPKDDLKKIEGIGPKIEEILYAQGITTFAALASTEAATVKGYLTDAGSRFASHDPTTWGQQAQMAADGKWDELKKWQDELDGGKVVAAKDEEE